MHLALMGIVTFFDRKTPVACLFHCLFSNFLLIDRHLQVFPVKLDKIAELCSIGAPGQPYLRHLDQSIWIS